MNMTPTSPQLAYENVVTLDFETYFDKDVSLTKLNTQEYVAHELFKVWGVGIKTNDNDTEWYGEDEAEAALNDIDWDKTILVCHNTLFDGYVLAEIYDLHPYKYCDTAAMARGIEPHKSASLKDVAERTFPDDESMRKGEELIDAKGIYDLPYELELTIGDYCIQDVDLTYAIFQELAHQYPISELEIIDLTTRMFCQPKLVLDEDMVRTSHDEAQLKTAEMIEASGLTRADLASRQKFAAHLESIGIVPPTKRSATTGLQIPAFGQNDAGWKQMVKMYPQHQNLWDARRAVSSRIEETRAARLLQSTNKSGQMPVPLRYYNAHTGRFAGTEKINLQNLPRGSDLRKCLTAPADNYVYVADLNAIEARMLAWLAGEHKLLDAFAANEDVYCNFASMIYGTEITKANYTERFLGKTAVLGLGYGMGKDRFADTLSTNNIQYDDNLPQKVINLYRFTYAMIPAYWSIAKAMLFAMLDPSQHGNRFGPITVDHHKLLLPNGMYLSYPDLQFNEHTHEFTFQGKNKTTRIYGGMLTENITQALSRIVITDAMLRLQDRLKPLAGTVVHTVHDEILIVAPRDKPDEMMDILIEEMCIAPAWAPDIPLLAEGEYGPRYGK